MYPLAGFKFDAGRWLSDWQLRLPVHDSRVVKVARIGLRHHRREGMHIRCGDAVVPGRERSMANGARPVYQYEGEYEHINTTKDIRQGCAVWSNHSGPGPGISWVVEIQLTSHKVKWNRSTRIVRFKSIKEQDTYSGFAIICAKECISDVFIPEPWCRDMGKVWPIGSGLRICMRTDASK
jgi:hypothetical protein